MIESLSHLGMIAIEGPDAEKFLQGQLTCDVSKVNETNSTWGGHCDPKGRLLSFFRLCVRDGAYLMLLPLESVPQTIQA